MLDKIKYIEILLIKREDFFGGNQDIIIHSILNTIELNELISLYLTKDVSNIKNSIESNILKRFEHTSNPKEQYESLYIELQKAGYHTRQRIKNLQFSLLNRLDEMHYKDFFKIYFNSKYYYENTIALSISGKIWNKEINGLILERYMENKKDPYLKTLLEHGDISLLIPLLEKIWSNELKSYLKMEILRKSALVYFDSFSFLKKLDPEKYLYAMSISGKKFSNSELLSVYNEIESNKKHYGLMSLGRLNKWNLIKPELKKYIS